MAERQAVLPQLSEDLRDVRWQVETPTRVIGRQLSYLESQVLSIQTQLSAIDQQVRHPVEQSDDHPGNGLERLNPWHADFSIWAYISLLSLFMLIAFALQLLLI